MTDTAQNVLLLVISIGLTFLVARLLVRAGEPFLQEVFQDSKVSHSVNMLLSVLFILVTGGVLLIISTIDVDTGDLFQTLVLKLGVVLVVLGIAYGISLLVLIRVRERRRADQISEQVSERLADRGVAAAPPASPLTIKSAPPIPPAAPLAQPAPAPTTTTAPTAPAPPVQP